MKKLILSFVFVFATGTMMNASNNNSATILVDCFEDAWEFGTEEGEGDDTVEWEMMDKYYTMWCS